MNAKKKALTRGEKVCAFIETYCLETDKLEKFQRKFLLEIYDNPVGTHTAMLSIARRHGKTALITETKSRKLKEQLGMSDWIDASLEKPPKLMGVLVQCEDLDPPVLAYWIPANTADRGPLQQDNVVHSVYRPYPEGWYTGKSIKNVHTPLKHKVISWQYAPSWSQNTPSWS